MASDGVGIGDASTSYFVFRGVESNLGDVESLKRDDSKEIYPSKPASMYMSNAAKRLESGIEREQALKEALDLLQKAVTELKTFMTDYAEPEYSKKDPVELQKDGLSAEGNNEWKRKRLPGDYQGASGESSKSLSSLQSVGLSSVAASTSDVIVTHPRRRHVRNETTPGRSPLYGRGSDNEHSSIGSDNQETFPHPLDHELPSQLLTMAFPSNPESSTWRTKALALVENSLPLDVILDPARHMSKFS